MAEVDVSVADDTARTHDTVTADSAAALAARGLLLGDATSSDSAAGRVPNAAEVEEVEDLGDPAATGSDLQESQSQVARTDEVGQLGEVGAGGRLPAVEVEDLGDPAATASDLQESRSQAARTDEVGQLGEAGAGGRLPAAGEVGGAADHQEAPRAEGRPEAAAAQPRSVGGRIWLLPLAPRASATVEVSFPSGGVEWAAAVSEPGHEMELRVVMEGQGWERVLAEGRGWQFEGRTKSCKEKATVRLRVSNPPSSGGQPATAEVSIVPFGPAASGRQGGSEPHGHWLSTRATAAEALAAVGRMVTGTYLQRDLRLKADRLEVVEVQQVAHSGLWGRYLEMRGRIAEELVEATKANHSIRREVASDVKTHQYSPEPLEAAANEAWLFHGTSPAIARAIADEGFAEGSHMEHGRAFGKGLYFTECSSKADFYTKPAQAEVDIPEYAGLCCMLLCRVALGRTLVVDVAGAPDKKGIAADFAKGEHHSILGDREHLLDSYREFVVPHAAQVVPTFLIWYRRLQKSSFERWKDRNFGGSITSLFG